MKKIFLLVLVALLAVVLVACGGETTTASTTTAAPDVTTTPEASGSTTPESTTSDPDTTTAPDTENNAVFKEGENILNGNPAYNAIDPFWNGLWPIAFENHHPELNFRWCLVFKMLPTEEFVQEQLIAVDEEAVSGVVFDTYTWTLIINGEEHVIDNFCIAPRTGFIYVRMDLGADYAPLEGENDYDIKLKIADAESGDIIFWAWFADPEISSPYTFTKPADIEVVPGEVPTDVEALPENSLQGISGPAGVNASETYVNLFDGEVRSKLCGADASAPIIFTIKDNVSTFSIKGISIVGANDDEKFPERVIAKFKVYGANTGEEDAAWDLLLTVDKTEDFGTVKNYGEVYYALDKTVEYRYYRVEIETTAARYQLSEILLYAEKGSVTTG